MKTGNLELQVSSFLASVIAGQEIDDANVADCLRQSAETYFAAEGTFTKAVRLAVLAGWERGDVIDTCLVAGVPEATVRSTVSRIWSAIHGKQNQDGQGRKEKNPAVTEKLVQFALNLLGGDAGEASKALRNAAGAAKKLAQNKDEA